MGTTEFDKHNPNGEKWRGFAAAKELGRNLKGIVLISMPRQRGRAASLSAAGHRWVLPPKSLFHCGTLDGESRVPGVVTTGRP